MLDDDEFADKSVRKGGRKGKKEEEPAVEVDFEAEKEKWREQMKKEVAEADADSEEESYNLDEEQLDALLDAAEKEIFQSEEDAIKYFEEYYKQIKAKRVKLNKYRPRIPDTRDEQDIQILEDAHEVESLLAGEEWVLDEKTARKYYKDLDNGFSRYPNGFRHYENFANYKLMNPQSEISEYVDVMNAQCDYETFLAIQRTKVLEVAQDPYEKHLEANNESDYPENKNEITGEDYVHSEMFVRETRQAYEEKVQERLA